MPARPRAAHPQAGHHGNGWGAAVGGEQDAGHDQGIFHAQQRMFQDGLARLALDFLTNGLVGHNGFTRSEIA
ncbi:MAG: hypothetical protein IPO15_04920 [Anaerolineae bacterium]|uniref:hypothetical protein n=1 Tax=Candidatus Amarolinea dominans TaxID=3140696 RepID=UPI0031351709|nr:hypothetical protein [Anaerolineae bacterium]